MQNNKVWKRGDYLRLSLTTAPWLSLKTNLKNFFFLFSRTKSLERAFLPSSTIQTFSVVEASSVLAVVVAISYYVTMMRAGEGSQNTCSYACNYAHRLTFVLTGFVTAVYRVIVGTGQLPHYLPIIFLFRQPAVTGEPKGLVHGLISHINILQVPTRSRASLQPVKRTPL